MQKRGKEKVRGIRGLFLEEDGVEAEKGWFPSVDHGAWGATGRRNFFIPNGDSDFSPGLPQ